MHFFCTPSLDLVLLGMRSDNTGEQPRYSVEFWDRLDVGGNLKAIPRSLTGPTSWKVTYALSKKGGGDGTTADDKVIWSSPM